MQIAKKRTGYSLASSSGQWTIYAMLSDVRFAIHSFELFQRDSASTLATTAVHRFPNVCRCCRSDGRVVGRHQGG
jgi:hypothetical protein